MKTIIILLIAFGLSSLAYSQGVARQSINTLGSSSTVNGINYQQAVGQPYQTQTGSLSSSDVRPGFIQSSSMKIESIVNETDRDINMNVYPNPAKESFTVQSDENYENVSIRVVNSIGEVVEQLNVKDFRTHNVNCSSWQNGTYFITVMNEKGEKSTSKLIITK